MWILEKMPECQCAGQQKQTNASPLGAVGGSSAEAGSGAGIHTLLLGEPRTGLHLAICRAYPGINELGV